MSDKSNTNKEVVYFHMATKGAGKRHCPNIEPFKSILEEESEFFVFDDDWAKENQLCILVEFYTEFLIFYFTATKEWVEKNCPALLTEYNIYTKQPDAEGNVYTKRKNKYLEYKPEYFGIFVDIPKSVKRIPRSVRRLSDADNRREE